MARKGETLSAETRAKITGRPRSAKAGPSAIHTALRLSRVVSVLPLDPHTRNRADFRFDESVMGRGRNLNAAKTHAELQAAGRKGAAIRWNLPLVGKG